MAHVKLTPEVRDILERSTITSTTVKLPQQLPRNLYDAVMKVIKNCGGEWKRGPQCHVFSGDPRVKLGLTLATGVAMDLKKTFQFFPTPRELAARVVNRVHASGCSVLEPSAGRGSLVLECLRLSSPTRIAMIELNPENIPYLKSIPAEGKDLFVHCADFLSLTPATAPIGLRGQFDRVIMNPPFNKGQDLKHITHAVTHWLKPGGQLFALMLPHEDDAISQALGAADDLCSWTTEDIDAGAFKQSGTNIRTSLLLLEKSAGAAEAKVAPILPPIPPQIAFHASLSDLPLFALPEAT
jgi:predicted RNA methylase